MNQGNIRAVPCMRQDIIKYGGEIGKAPIIGDLGKDHQVE